MNLYRKIRKRLWLMSMIGLARGPHVTRYFMYDRLRLVGSQLSKKSGRVLAISHSANLVEITRIQPTSLIQADYPEHSILDLKFPDASFDFVLSDQVLEHVEGNPQQAIDECHRVLAPGGIAIHTTCLVHPIHYVPKDFWRFTPDALSLLHQKWTEVIDVGGWGNFAVWTVDRDGVRYVGVPHAKWHPLHWIAIKNDPAWPIATWIVSQK